MTIRWLDTEVEKKENHTNVGVSIPVPSMGWKRPFPQWNQGTLARVICEGHSLEHLLMPKSPCLRIFFSHL